MPTYRVDRPGVELPRVVEAAMPAIALQHVVQDEITVRRIDVAEAFGLAEQGVKLERAGETPPAAEPEPADLGTANEDDAKSDLDNENEDDETEFAEEREQRPELHRDFRDSND